MISTTKADLRTPECAFNGRETWLECARVLAMVVVVFEHIPYQASFNFYNVLFFWAPVSFFFLVSGFFLGRKGYPASQWIDCKRAGLLLLPFIFWQCVTLGSAFGLRGICMNVSLQEMTPGLWLSQFLLSPADSPLWFLRDLAALSFLAPVLLKFPHILPFLTLLIVLTGNTLDPHPFIPPSDWCFFFAGLLLSKRSSLADLRHFVKSHNRCIAGLFLLLSLAMLVLKQEMKGSVSPFLMMRHGTWYSLPASIVGVAALASFGVWWEELFPKAARKIASLGASSFLVYAAHVPILSAMKGPLLRLDIENPAKWSLLSFLYPALLAPAIYAVCHVLYLLIQRCFPWSLPFLAAQNPRRNSTR